MSASRTHLELTKEEVRAEEIPCVIRGVDDISPTVRRLRLTTLDGSKALRYEAGQWVDTFIPNVPIVGGYSFVSAPAPNLSQAAKQSLGLPLSANSFDLAIKRSRHAPAAWVHSDACRVGAQVSIRVGGLFTPSRCGILVPMESTGVSSTLSEESAHPGLPSLSFSGRYSRLLLLAGGVGINPLYSILLGLADAAAAASSQLSASSSSRARSTHTPHIFLAYSSRTPDEFLFLEHLRWLSESTASPLYQRLHIYLTATGGKAGSGEKGGAMTSSSSPTFPLTSASPSWLTPSLIYRGRLSSLLLEQALSTPLPLMPPNTTASPGQHHTEGSKGISGVLLCGPLSFSDEFTLRFSGLVGTENVHREKWY